MELNNITLNVEDGIAVLTINRPKAMNALNGSVMSELNEVFSELESMDIKGVILTGAGEKAFVAGADITEFSSLDAVMGKEYSRKGHEIFNRIERFQKPVIAAVNGYALGGGCELAMSCHLRVAGPGAKFGQPEVNLGIIPGYGGTQRLIQYIGKGKAMELLLTGDMIGAEEALRLGLVNHVAEQGGEIDLAKKILHKIGTKGPVAIAKIIECVNAHFDDDKAFNAEIDAFGQTVGTEDSKEGAAAFLEKRKPNFQGH